MCVWTPGSLRWALTFMEAAGRVRAHNDPGERAAPSAGGGLPTVPGGQGVDGAPGAPSAAPRCPRRCVYARSNTAKLTNSKNSDAVFNEFIHANVFSFRALMER